MFIDAREGSLVGTLQGQVCVVGGGVAGITLALSLARRGVEVVLVESGGLVSDPETNDLYAGPRTTSYHGAEGGLPGLDYAFDHHNRSRFLGGSSNCWGGWCRPLEAEDFEQRSWVEDSGWPFDRSELTGCYERAHEVLDLGPTDYDATFWAAAVRHPQVHPAPLDPHHAVEQWSQFSGRLRLGARYRDELATSSRIRVLLHANLTRIHTSTYDGSVTHLTLGTLGTPARAETTVRAERYVLAMGGIENARLLLASAAAGSPGLGQQHDLVGRYFMDHPRRLMGEVRMRPAYRDNRLHDIRRQDRSPVVAAHGTSVAAAFSLTPEVRAAEGLLNGLAFFRTMLAAENTSTVAAIRRLRRVLTHGEPLDAGHRDELSQIARHPLQASGYVAARVLRAGPLLRGRQLEVMVEPAPDRDSRVTLSDERDALGVPRVEVAWRLGDQVRHTFDRTAQLLAAELARAGIADVDVAVCEPDWKARTTGTWHHMGTTRMHDSPRHGVVDRDARVHGCDNLYVAGSSTFPTVGANYPTLTLTALALRLADHLVAEVARPIEMVEVARPTGGPPVPQRFESGIMGHGMLEDVRTVVQEP